MFINKAAKLFSNLTTKLNRRISTNYRKYSRVVRSSYLSRFMIAGSIVWFISNSSNINAVEIKRPNEVTKTYVCQSKDILEGQVLGMDCLNEKGELSGKVVLVRYKNKVYAVGGLCTFDTVTLLQDGICFNDKLYCPKHGCAYDIETGSAQLAPAIYNLPKFYTEEIDGKVYVYIPKRVPKRVDPEVDYRDYTDLRKVVIIGSGVSAFGCVEGLRQNGFTGEITIITQQSEYPYDKSLLVKSMKRLDYQKLKYKPDSWYIQGGINVLFGRSVQEIQNKHKFPFVVLEDGTRIQFDGLVVATGSISIVPKIQNLTESNKSFYLRNINDHKKLKDALNTAKKITVVGLNSKSLEFCNTVRREYPDIQITVLDQNPQDNLTNKYGEQITQQLIQSHYAKGISFFCKTPIQTVVEKDDKININLKIGRTIQSDIAVLFPNNDRGNNKVTLNSRTLQTQYDKSGRIKTDSFSRTDNKKIFAVGGCAGTQYFYNNKRMPCNIRNVAYHSGYIAAYNLLALNIPFHYIPFEYSAFGDKELQLVGYNKDFDKLFVVGDIKSWDFMVFYVREEQIVGVATTPKTKYAAPILLQAFRQQIMPPLKQLQSQKWDLPMLETIIRRLKKSGCYKDPIRETKQNYNMEDIIWMHRDGDEFIRDPTTEEGYLPGRINEQGYFKQT